MAIDFEVRSLADFKEFRRDLDDIDMERVERRTNKRIAEELTKMVRTAVIAENDIVTPSINSKWGSGSQGGEGRSRGPSMSQHAAWIVEPDGTTSFTVKPHPKVEQRAHVLNYGYPGRIYPTSADALRFKLNGIPMVRDSVPGPDKTGYWEKAVDKLQKSNKPQEIAEDELEREVEDSV